MSQSLKSIPIGRFMANIWEEPPDGGDPDFRWFSVSVNGEDDEPVASATRFFTLQEATDWAWREGERLERHVKEQELTLREKRGD